MALTNQQLLTRGDRRYAAKKKAAAGVAALEYDPASRQDFLSGFHKRKLARQTEAKRRADELNRQQRVIERRRLREARRAQVEPGLDRLKEAEALIRGVPAPGGSVADGDSPAYEDALDREPVEPQTDGDDNEFCGFDDNSGILKRRELPYGDSQVTIEEISMDPFVDMSRSEAVLDEATRKANAYASYVEALDGFRPAQPEEQPAEEQAAKQRKKKFKYLPKAERKRAAGRKRRA